MRRRQNHLRTWCHVVRTQHHQPTTPGSETIRTEGPYHGPINDPFSAGQGQLMKILIYFWWAAKTIAGSYMRVTMGKLMVWALKLDPSLDQDTK